MSATTVRPRPVPLMTFVTCIAAAAVAVAPRPLAVVIPVATANAPVAAAMERVLVAADGRGFCVCRDHPAVFCLDLMNEPIVGRAREGEPAWLTGEMEGFHFVQRIARELGGREPAAVAAAWVAEMMTAIREVDPRVLVTVGVIPWSQVWPGAVPIFYTPEAARHLDFVSVHLYPRSGRLDADLAVLDDYAIGKPIVIEETFPLECSQEDFDAFVRRSRGKAVGWIGHHFGRTIAEHRAANGIRDAVMAAFLESWQRNAP